MIHNTPSLWKRFHGWSVLLGLVLLVIMTDEPQIHVALRAVLGIQTAQLWLRSIELRRDLQERKNVEMHLPIERRNTTERFAGTIGDTSSSSSSSYQQKTNHLHSVQGESPS